MSRDTLALAKAELVGLLWSSNAPTFTVSGIDAAAIHVYDHEPRSLEYPFPITVATAGMDADFWVLSLRVYANIADAKKAQDLLDLLIPAVNAKTANGGFGPSAWDITWDDKLEVLVATNLLNVGREDMGDVGY